MATIAPLNFTKDWTDPSDFPTTEPDEARARADMQELHNQTREYINNTLVPAIPTGVTEGDQNMRGYRITEVGDPEEDSDAVNKEYVDAMSEDLKQKIENAGSDIQLSSSVTSTSTTTAANSYAVKKAYDKALEATKVSLSTPVPVYNEDAKATVLKVAGFAVINIEFLIPPGKGSQIVELSGLPQRHSGYPSTVAGFAYAGDRAVRTGLYWPSSTTARATLSYDAGEGECTCYTSFIYVTG